MYAMLWIDGEMLMQLSVCACLSVCIMHELFTNSLAAKNLMQNFIVNDGMDQRNIRKL